MARIYLFTMKKVKKEYCSKSIGIKKDKCFFYFMFDDVDTLIVILTYASNHFFPSDLQFLISYTFRNIYKKKSLFEN